MPRDLPEYGPATADDFLAQKWSADDTTPEQVGLIVERLRALPSNEARREVLDKFCTHCGGVDLPCHCWKDT